MDPWSAAFGIDQMEATSSSMLPISADLDLTQVLDVSEPLFPQIPDVFGEFDSAIPPMSVQTAPVSPSEEVKSPMDIVKTWRTRSRRQSMCDLASNEKRLEVNRMSAKISRERKKMFVEILKSQVNQLTDETNALKTLILRLNAENSCLRQGYDISGQMSATSFSG